MNKHHELKTDPKFYLEVSQGHKTFEVRVNDRDFTMGDQVTLKEFDRTTQTFTGNELSFKIGYVLSLGDFFGNDNKYCVFSLVDKYETF